MRNNELLSYDTIVQATSGEPEAVNTVLQYYGRRIRYASRISGQADKEAEDFITETLLKALFKFRFSRVFPPDTTEYPPPITSAHTSSKSEKGLLLFLRPFLLKCAALKKVCRSVWQNCKLSVVGHNRRN